MPLFVRVMRPLRNLHFRWGLPPLKTPISRAPERLDAALIFAPIGGLIPIALAATKKGGSVVCGGIHMSEIPAFDYSLLWQERKLLSVANLTRQDAEEFLAFAGKFPFNIRITPYPLMNANEALQDLESERSRARQS